MVGLIGSQIDSFVNDYKHKLIVFLSFVTLWYNLCADVARSTLDFTFL